MEQRTLKIDDETLIYCYVDGSVEWNRSIPSRYKIVKKLYRTFGYKKREGYLEIKINKKAYKVHRLIAAAFCDNPNNLKEVDHINRNKSDNRPSNLRWCTRKENNDNKDYIDACRSKYGVRKCEDKKAYGKAYRKSVNYLRMTRPDGKDTSVSNMPEDIYNILKPLSQKERYIKYQELKKE